MESDRRRGCAVTRRAVPAGMIASSGRSSLEDRHKLSSHTGGGRLTQAAVSDRANAAHGLERTLGLLRNPLGRPFPWPGLEEAEDDTEPNRSPKD